MNWGGNGGWADNTPGVFPDTLQISFNGLKSIYEIDLFTAQDTPSLPLFEPDADLTFTNWGITAFTLQYLDANGVWQNVPGGSVTGNHNVWRKINFVTVNASAIRIIVNAAGDNYSRVVELEAWGTDLQGGSNPTAGGANLAWWYLDQSSGDCIREPYGIIHNYQTNNPTNPLAKGQIDALLQQMYDQGMRRLRIPIFFGHGLNTGTVLDSSGGNLSAQDRQNLTDLLNTIRSIGFLEVLPSFMAVGAYNDPVNPSYLFDETHYQENWQLIQNLRPIFVNSGLFYRFDLGNELMPVLSQTSGGVQRNMLLYTQRLWSDYANTYGKNDTVGFSVIGGGGDATGRLASLPSVYGSNAPYLLAINIYEDAYNNFIADRNQLQSMGPPWSGWGWIIAETFFNDAANAAAFRQAINATGQTVFYLTQWPETNPRGVGVLCYEVNVGGPAAFWNYSGYGF